MHVALDRDELLLVKVFGQRSGTRRLRFVPFAVDLGQRMNVMRSLIRVHDLQFLAYLHGQDVRRIAAVLLFEGDRLAWGGLFIRRSRRDVNHDVVQRVAGAGYDGFGQRRGRGSPCANWILRHVDRFWFWRWPPENGLAAS